MDFIFIFSSWTASLTRETYLTLFTLERVAEAEGAEEGGGVPGAVALQHAPLDPREGAPKAFDVHTC